MQDLRLSSCSKLTVMNWREKLVIAVNCVACTVAIFVFVAALRTEGTDENPAGIAGMYAPLIALSVAIVAATGTFGIRHRLILRWRAISIGIGGLLSAYLWIAAEAKTHPSDLRLLSDLALLWGVAAVLSLGLVMVLWAIPFESDN